ncbi:MAG: acetate--CoA ligase family protein, partial [bacterium]|nr:acetate--CoA ligase family protein [bacterium]
MKIHEYQAKELCRKYGVEVPRGKPAFSVEEAVAIADELGYPVVVKAQIHAGGRGKGGGVKLAKNRDEAKQYAWNILGMQLITHQTGPEGKKVQRLLIEEAGNIVKEFYAGIVLDRETGRNVVMVSTEGGMEIEKVAVESPEKIVKIWVNPAIGFRTYQARQLAYALGLSGEQHKQATKFLSKLYEMYIKSDASLAEI